MCVNSNDRSGSTPASFANIENLWNSFNKSVAAVEECWEYDPCAGTSTQCYWYDVNTISSLTSLLKDSLQVSLG